MYLDFPYKEECGQERTLRGPLLTLTTPFIREIPVSFLCPFSAFSKFRQVGKLLLRQPKTLCEAGFQESCGPTSGWWVAGSLVSVGCSELCSSAGSQVFLTRWTEYGNLQPLSMPLGSRWAGMARIHTVPLSQSIVSTFLLLFTN